VKHFRVNSALLICASVLALAACGGADKDSTTGAGSAPTATSTAAAPSAAPATSAATDAAGGSSDKEICASIKKAGEDMKASLIESLKSGAEPTPAVFKKILTEMNDELTSLAEAGGSDSKVTAALKTFGAETAKAAKAADPAAAADNPAYEKAGADVTAACKPTGINVNF
jgi:hypothetical protein